MMKINDTYDIPGPIDWHNASHWIEYDHDNRTVETWCKMGHGYKFRLRTRVRPMAGSEIIHSKLRDYTREEVLKAYGVVVPPVPNHVPKKQSLMRRWFGKKE